MRVSHVAAGLLGLVVCISTARAPAASAAVSYAIVDRIPGPGTDWDYLAVDPVARRLYIAHNGVTVLDLNTNKLTPRLVPGGITHQVLPLGDGIVAVDDSTAGTLTVFEGASGKVRATLQVPKPPAAHGFRDPDGLVLEPKTGLLVAVNADSGELVLIDLKPPAIVGTIAIGGALDAAVADGTGKLFVNVASKNEIATVDIVGRKLVRRFPLQRCEEPSAIEFDPPDDLLISVCDSGAVEFVAAESGHIVRTLAVGKGPDAVLFDVARRLVFVPSGEAGTLSIIAVRSRADIALVQTLPTQVGARTAALDPQTGRIYLPAARFKPPTAQFPFPSAIEGTFVVLVVGPK